MQVTKTYPSKSNTISRNQEYVNLGLNPVMEINYGKMLTRGLIYFDHNKVKQMVEDKTYVDVNKLHHTLKMVNCASLESNPQTHSFMDSTLRGTKFRATSFNLILFLIPELWDEGKGFDYVQDMYGSDHKAYSTEGSSWMQCQSHIKWEESGIFTSERLSRELDLFTQPAGNKSDIVCGFQHFDHGNEDIEIDVTDVFNKFITGELENYGFGIAFSPAYEEIEDKLTSSYVGFFTHHTNSYFKPYIETTYEDAIEDDRSNFYLNKDNKLYFYVSIGGNFINLDEYPTCMINGVEYEVKQATKGTYYVDINLSSEEYDAGVMFYDAWSNIKYNGRNFADVELEFVTKSDSEYFTFGLPSVSKECNIKFVPSIYGINMKEQIKKGDIRKVNVECYIPYTSNQLHSVDNMEYRVYVKGCGKEMDAIPWQKVERGYNQNYFIFDTNDFVPSRYYIDIRVKQNMELTYHRNLIEFDIISDLEETKK